jgi:hypothetical protein
MRSKQEAGPSDRERSADCLCLVIRAWNPPWALSRIDLTVRRCHCATAVALFPNVVTIAKPAACTVAWLVTHGEHGLAAICFRAHVDGLALFH